ncbi:MAG TPA: hypothetical protein PKA41_12935 [Verrucomicrobiota bacterium]|nr:hypothetical protein [Verrucomicrobiota bacterium]
MKKRIPILAVLLLAVTLAHAEVLKEFPPHWGKPPEIQLRDYVKWPDGYGHGSSTVAKWIEKNIAKDKEGAAAATPVAPATTPLYANDFEKAEAGQLPDDFMALEGEFVVKSDGTNKFLELPGAPLDSFAVLFGPATNANVSVAARICGTSRGRLHPVFGVGACGVVGYRLQVSPAKGALELYKDTELKASVPYEWKSGVWTRLRLQVVEVKGGEWIVQCKAWADGSAEPSAWRIEFQSAEKPPTGRSSVTGSPFSGKPIQFDDVAVERAAQ